MLVNKRLMRCHSRREVVGMNEGFKAGRDVTLRLHPRRDILSFIREQLLHFT